MVSLITAHRLSQASFTSHSRECVGILTCFLSLSTLNRSKSVRAFRRSCCSRFLAQLDSAHFLSTSCFSHSFFTAPVPAAFGRLGMTQGVRETMLVGIACRGTTEPSFVEGPSTRICARCKSNVRPVVHTISATYSARIYYFDDGCEFALKRS